MADENPLIFLAFDLGRGGYDALWSWPQEIGRQVTSDVHRQE